MQSNIIEDTCFTMQVTFEYGNVYDAKLTNTLDTKYSQL